MHINTKVLFTDLDDTLLNSQKQITPENVRAIENALSAGHLIVINTGRPLAAALPLIRSLNLERKGCYAITFNGGLLYDCFEKKVLYKKSLPLEYVHYIFEHTAAAGLHCQTYDNTHLLSAKNTVEMQNYVKKTGVTPRIVPDLPYSLTEEPVKLLAIDEKHPENLHAFRRELSEWADGKVSIFFSSDTYLEFVSHGVSKGAAMQTLCKMLDIPMENTIGIGDAENDIPMLKTAHIGVAMKNATSEVKAVANYITELDCDQSGFAEAIEKFLLT